MHKDKSFIRLSAFFKRNIISLTIPLKLNKKRRIFISDNTTDHINLQLSTPSKIYYRILYVQKVRLMNNSLDTGVVTIISIMIGGIVRLFPYRM